MKSHPFYVKCRNTRWKTRYSRLYAVVARYVSHLTRVKLHPTIHLSRWHKPCTDSIIESPFMRLCLSASECLDRSSKGNSRVGAGQFSESFARVAILFSRDIAYQSSTSVNLKSAGRKRPTMKTIRSPVHPLENCEKCSKPHLVSTQAYIGYRHLMLKSTPRSWTQEFQKWYLTDKEDESMHCSQA